MRTPFRQGIIQHQDTGTEFPYFLAIDVSGGINFLANQELTIITFADRDKNYLLTEFQTINNAWPGPFNPGVDYWLYWDLNAITGDRTFGHTLLEPVHSLTPPPNPAIDQHWFDLTTTQMKVWRGVSWKPMLRVFSCKFENGAVITKPSPLMIGFTGTQVDLNIPSSAGALVFDKNGVAIRAGDKFFTTEDIFVTGVPTAAQIRFESILLEAVSGANMAHHTVVNLSDFDEFLPADSFDLGVRLVGVIEKDVTVGDTIHIITEGVVTNIDWNWPTVNAPVFVDAFGNITTTVDLPAIPCGVVIAPKQIFFRNPAMGVVTQEGIPAPPTAPGGGGDATPHNAIALVTNIEGAPVVVETADPPLAGQVLYAISPTTAIWKYITTEDVITIAELIVINGPLSILEGSTSSGPYTTTVTWSDGTETIEVPAWNLISPNVSATIDGSAFVTVGTTPAATTFDIEATFVDTLGNIVQDTITIDVVILVGVSVSGASELFETESENYTAVAQWSDGSTTPITNISMWSENGTSTTIDQSGFLSAGLVTADEGLTVSAEYSWATKTQIGTKGVLVKDNYVTSLLLSGPSQVDEKKNPAGQYAAQATWRNGSNQNVTNATVWSTDVAITLADVNVVGTLQTGAVQTNTPAIIQGNYTSELVTVNDMLNITIRDVPPPPRYGAGAPGGNSEAFILALTGELPNYDTGYLFTITANPGQKMYFAYLASAGLATIEDITGGAGFTGGWDAAGNPGPIIVQVSTDGVLQNWYVYETDNAGLGTREYRINSYL